MKGGLTTPQGFVECRVLANMPVQDQCLINHAHIIKYLCSKCLDLVPLLRMLSLVCRIEKSLSIELDAALDRRVDSPVDSCAEMFDTR
jgi:hypothetical protein